MSIYYSNNRVYQSYFSFTATIDNDKFTLQIGGNASSSSTTEATEQENMLDTNTSPSVVKLQGTIAHTATYIDASKPYSTDNIAQAHNISRILLVQEHMDNVPVSSATLSTPGYFQTTSDPMPGSQLKVATSGITPPLRDIVNKQHVSSWKYITRYSIDEIIETERTILDLIHNNEDPRYEHVVEELVDAEAFMAGWFRGEGATDNATLVYENGILQDIYSMDKGRLNKRTGTGALLRLPTTTNTVNKATTSTASVAINSSLPKGDGAVSGNLSITGTTMIDGNQPLLNTFNEGDLLLVGLNDDEDDDDDGDYYNDDDDEEGVNEVIEDEEEEMTNLNLPTTSTTLLSSNNLLMTDDDQLQQPSLTTLPEELDLDTTNNNEQNIQDIGEKDDTNIDMAMEEDTLTNNIGKEEPIVMDPRIIATEEALQRAKDELAIAQKQFNSTTIAAFKNRAANTVNRVQAEIDRLEKELAELKSSSM